MDVCMIVFVSLKQFGIFPQFFGQRVFFLDKKPKRWNPTNRVSMEVI